jgi:hypothetical protein
MADVRRFGLADLLLLALVLAVAASARAGYLVVCADSGHNGGPLRVEDPWPAPGTLDREKRRGKDHPTELDALVHNIAEGHGFMSPAPFSPKTAPGEEETAHVAPGYPFVLAGLSRWTGLDALDHAVRWGQCALGSLTAGLYFLFARRAFHHRGVATLAGLLCALHPFAVIDTAAINDGVLTSFLVALAVWLGTRAGQEGGAFASLLFGLSLAGAALVRAALLPFGLAAMCWLLFRSRTLPRGWLGALLALLGFINGLAPWAVRNFQVFGEPLPVVDSAQYHLWVGNNAQADGGPATDAMLAEAPAAELSRLRQPERFSRLGGLAWQNERNDPAGAVRRRLRAGVAFVFGDAWLRDGTLAERVSPPEGELPEGLQAAYPVILEATLLGMLVLGFLGWRWTYGWRWEAMPSSLAVMWIPLPYILSHAARVSGPRLPLDGVLLSYAAFALVCLVPGVGGLLLQGGKAEHEHPAGRS